MASNNKSPWFTDVPDTERFPHLATDVSCDVVVIGAGMAGVLTAWRLHKAGKKVVLLEQAHIATGDSGYTTAFLTRVPDLVLPDLKRRYGLDFVRRAFQANVRAQRFLFDLIEQEVIACDFHSCPSYHRSEQAHDKDLAAEWAVVKDIDPTATLSPNGDAICYANEGRFHVRKFLLALCEKMAAGGVRIFEGSEVTSIASDKGVAVTTNNTTVQARSAVVTVGLPSHLFPDLAARFSTSTDHVVQFRFDSVAPIEDAVFWDTAVPYHYYRRFDDHSIMVGLDSRETKHPAPVALADIHAFAKAKFGEQFTVEREWAGAQIFAEDGLPFSSQHPDKPHIFLGCGFGGNGMVMGATASGVLAELASGKINDDAPLFSFARTVKKTKRSNARLLVRFALLLTAAAIAVLPGFAFFHLRGGLAFLSGATFRDASLGLFPLFGLYAFFLVWLQIVTGPLTPLLRKVFPGITRFHRWEGIFALVFACLHPLLLLVGVGLASFLDHSFVAPELNIYVWLGIVQWTLIVLTAGTALLMRHPWFRKHWRLIHYGNYLVFVSVWIHSWFLGSDVQHSSLRSLWFFYGVTGVVAFLLRLQRAVKKHRAATASATPAADGVIRVAASADVKEGGMLCARLNGSLIALFRTGGTVYATDNVCTHEGGPLCEGALVGSSIECPWHGSRFDVRTGAVIKGPAQKPVRTYTVTERDGSIFVKS